MKISASLIAAELAARLDPVVPKPFVVLAGGTNLHVEYSGRLCYVQDFAFIEDPDEDRSPAELAELLVSNALEGLQDEVSETLTDPWPRHPSTEVRAMAPANTRFDGANVHLWYGVSEESPVVAFNPVELAKVARD